MLIVVGGYDLTTKKYLNNVELLNVNNIPYECNVPKNYPLHISNHVGGHVNERVMICNGYTVDNGLVNDNNMIFKTPFIFHTPSSLLAGD